MNASHIPEELYLVDKRYVFVGCNDVTRLLTNKPYKQSYVRVEALVGGIIIILSAEKY